MEKPVKALAPGPGANRPAVLRGPAPSQVLAEDNPVLPGAVVISEKRYSFLFPVALFDSAPVDSTILITGKSGVEKGLIAARIHKHSQRSGAPFTPINCGAIPETLLKSELFGCERGAPLHPLRTSSLTTSRLNWTETRRRARSSKVWAFR